MLNQIVRRGGGWLLRRGTRPALNAAQALIVPAAEQAITDDYRRVFNVTLPVTVYLYADHSRVTVRRQTGTQIMLHAALRVSFGIRLTVEHDEAGVYIIAKRMPVAGSVARANFTLTVPPETRLLMQLTDGSVILNDVEGLLEVLPLVKSS